MVWIRMCQPFHFRPLLMAVGLPNLDHVQMLTLRRCTPCSATVRLRERGKTYFTNVFEKTLMFDNWILHQAA